MPPKCRRCGVYHTGKCDDGEWLYRYATWIRDEMITPEKKAKPYPRWRRAWRKVNNFLWERFRIDTYRFYKKFDKSDR